MEERNLMKLILSALLETTIYAAVVAAIVLTDIFILKVRGNSFLDRECYMKAGIVYAIVFVAILVTLAVGGSSLRDAKKPREVSHTMVVATISGMISFFFVTYFC